MAASATLQARGVPAGPECAGGDGERVAGYETCEERGFTGGDADDIWFYYHPLCLERLLQAMVSRDVGERWVVEVYREISWEEAEAEEYLCDGEGCGLPLSRRPA